jgi:hypothetical protein
MDFQKGKLYSFLLQDDTTELKFFVFGLFLKRRAVHEDEITILTLSDDDPNLSRRFKEGTIQVLSEPYIDEIKLLYEQ